MSQRVLAKIFRERGSSIQYFEFLAYFSKTAVTLNCIVHCEGTCLIQQVLVRKQQEEGMATP